MQLTIMLEEVTLACISTIVLYDFCGKI